MNYADAFTFVRHYTNDHTPYDLNGVVHLMLAAAANLRENTEEDVVVDQMRASMAPSELDYLLRLVKRVADAGLMEDA